MIRMICRSGQPERQPQMVPLRFQFFQDHRSGWPFIGNDVRGMFYNIPQISGIPLKLPRMPLLDMPDPLLGDDVLISPDVRRNHTVFFDIDFSNCIHGSPHAPSGFSSSSTQGSQKSVSIWKSGLGKSSAGRL